MSKMTTLNSVCKVIYRYPQFYGMNKHETGVPVLRGEHLLKNKRISNNWSKFWFVDEAFSKKFPKTVLEYGDVVMSVRGSVGKIGLVEHQHAGAQISPNLIRISPNGEIINKKFAFFAIDWATEHFVARNSQAQALPSLSANDIKSMEIFCPPLAEQERIVEILSDADAAIATAGKQASLSLQKYEGERNRLLSSQYFPEKYTPPIFEQVFHPKIKQLAGDRNLEILSVTTEGIKPQAEHFNKRVASADSSKYLIIAPGELVLSGLNFWMGSVGILDTPLPGIVSPAYKIFVTDYDKWDRQFLSHYVRSQYFREILVNCSVQGASIVRRSLDTEALYQAPLKIPDLTMQKKIGHTLKLLAEENILWKRQVASLRKQKRGLMQQLLTGKLRVPEKYAEKGQ